MYHVNVLALGCRWSKGGLEEASTPAVAGVSSSSNGQYSSQVMLSAHKQQRAALDANTQRHVDGLPAQHVVVAGPPGSGKSWMLWEGTLAAGGPGDMREVAI